jgi:hypothetical protein
MDAMPQSDDSLAGCLAVAALVLMALGGLVVLGGLVALAAWLFQRGGWMR